MGVFDRRQTFKGDFVYSACGHSERPLIMPTDLDTASARKRAAQAHAQTEITIILVSLIICLVMFGLVFEVFGQ